MRKNRVFLTTVIGLVFVLALGPVAAASAGEGPVRSQWPFIPFTISGACSFDVYWEALAEKGYLTIHTDPDATRYIVTGVMKSRLTNLQTGKSIDLPNSSRYAQIFHADGSSTFISNGPGIWLWMPGLPAIAHVRGMVSFEFDAAGQLVKSAVNGTVLDLCEALAD